MRRSRTSLALAAVLVSPFAVPAPSRLPPRLLGDLGARGGAEALAEWAFARAGTCAGALSGGDSADWAAGSERCVLSGTGMHPRDGLVVEMGE